MGDYGDAYMAAIAEELRAQRARTKPRVTIAKIVARTGISKSAVLNYLNGKRDIPSGSLAEICRVLGVTPKVIAQRAEDALEKD